MKEKIPGEQSITVDPRVILHRDFMNSRELEDFQNTGCFSSPKKKYYDLEINGLTVARGVIKRKRGKDFFKITEMLGGQK